MIAGLQNTITYAKAFNITLKEIEVPPEQYKILVAEVLSVRPITGIPEHAEIYYHGIRITQKSCIGCCTHGTM